MTIHGEPSVTQFHPVGQSLSSLLTRQAAVTPNNTAIVSADRTMTFQDLQNASGQLARVLMDVGLKEDELVGVFKKNFDEYAANARKSIATKKA